MVLTTTEDRRENRRIDADPAGSIVVSHLTKDGRVRAVDDLSFSAEPGTGAPSPPRSAQS